MLYQEDYERSASSEPTPNFRSAYSKAATFEVADITYGCADADLFQRRGATPTVPIARSTGF